jgi:hypothetical protein
VGIDSNQCGFEVDDSTFKLIKNLIETKKISPKLLQKFWIPVQSIIPGKLEGDLFGSKAFFEWFKMTDLNLAGKPLVNPLSLLYFRLPYYISNTFRKVFHDQGIDRVRHSQNIPRNPSF